MLITVDINARLMKILSSNFIETSRQLSFFFVVAILTMRFNFYLSFSYNRYSDVRLLYLVSELYSNANSNCDLSAVKYAFGGVL